VAQRSNALRWRRTVRQARNAAIRIGMTVRERRAAHYMVAALYYPPTSQVGPTALEIIEPEDLNLDRIDVNRVA
jgi:hypothetical protein